MAQDRLPYLEIHPDIEDQIRLDRVNCWQNPYAFQDCDVIRREKKQHDAATVVRPAFVRDIEKILNTPAYNRYADKTQVFSFTENDEICRRGLHVQLVSRVARTIGQALGLNTDLIEAIALGHDVGHTPFGHAGERFLSALYQQHTAAEGAVRYFNHNVHSVRVLDQLYRRNISLQVLDGVLCHNGEFACQVLERGNLESFSDLDAKVESCMADERVVSTLRPSTLEGCVVRVSDMIAYIGKDRSDALALGAVANLDRFDTNVIGRTNSEIINNLTIDIINNSYRRDRIAMSREVYEDLKVAKRQNYELIYMREGMLDETSNVVEDMFANLYERLLDDVLMGDESSPLFRHHVKRLCEGSYSLTPDEYLKTDPNQIVVDYMASMTDDYFMAVYRYLFPGENPAFTTRDYCSDLL